MIKKNPRGIKQKWEIENKYYTARHTYSSASWSRSYEAILNALNKISPIESCQGKWPRSRKKSMKQVIYVTKHGRTVTQVKQIGLCRKLYEQSYKKIDQSIHRTGILANGILGKWKFSSQEGSRCKLQPTSCKTTKGAKNGRKKTQAELHPDRILHLLIVWRMTSQKP